MRALILVEADPVGTLLQLAYRDHLNVDLRVVLDQSRRPVLIVDTIKHDHLAGLADGLNMHDAIRAAD